jgi:hypothetical protein
MPWVLSYFMALSPEFCARASAVNLPGCSSGLPLPHWLRQSGFRGFILAFTIRRTLSQAMRQEQCGLALCSLWTAPASAARLPRTRARGNTSESRHTDSLRFSAYELKPSNTPTETLPIPVAGSAVAQALCGSGGRSQLTLPARQGTMQANRANYLRGICPECGRQKE